MVGRVPGRLLDVGCGTGDFLAGMAANGWDSSGLEFDAEAVAVARLHAGVRVHTGRLSDQRFPPSFEAITLSNVIEPLPNPDRVFAELRRFTAPGDLSILTASLELWNGRPRKAAAPKIDRLRWRETVTTLFKPEAGELVVLWQRNRVRRHAIPLRGKPQCFLKVRLHLPSSSNAKRYACALLARRRGFDVSLAACPPGDRRTGSALNRTLGLQLNGELTRSAEASHRSTSRRSPTASGADNGFELGRRGFDIMGFGSLTAGAAHFQPARAWLSE
jgi:SAM-dependent methyltransferase